MTFLNPFVLLGLVAVGIPLLIHLFNFRKPKRVDFSSLAFLREVQRSTMQRVRIKQWLLLLLRTLAIGALVLAFARPLVEGTLASFIGGTGASSIVIAVDRSPSMNVRDERGAYFDQARRSAEAIIASTDAQDEVMVISLDGSARAAFEPGGPPAAARLDNGEPSQQTTALSNGLEVAMDQLESAAHPTQEIYLISDLQASTLTDSTFEPAPTEAAVFLVPVGSAQPANVAISDVRVLSRIVEVDQPVLLEATLVNYGDTPAAAYVASVFLEDVRVAQASADLQPYAPTTVRFVVTPSTQGWLSGMVELEDDAFPVDNRYYFALNTPESRRVLLVQGDGTPVNALTTLLSEQISGGRSRFDLTTIPESRLAANDLGAFDVVVLAGPATLSSGEINRLAEYVDAGGGLFLMPGPSMNSGDYNELLSAVQAGATDGLTPAGNGEPIDVVDRIDVNHPLFEGVLEEEGRQVERPEVYRRMRYRPGSQTERSIMRLASGDPFLQEIRSGRGTVLVLTVAPDPDWSDLTSRGLIVPLVYRSIFLLSATESVEGERYASGTGGELLLPGMSETSRIALFAADGEEFVPERRRVVGGLLLDLRGRLPEPGVYSIMDEERVVRKVVANLDSRESDLRAAPQELAIAQLSGGGAIQIQDLIVDGTDQASARDALVEARRGKEIWNVFLLVALLCLLAEMLVAKRWRPEAST